MRNDRQVKIADLVRDHEVETQEELLALLRAEGYDVTQATVSRDIKKLRLTKVAGSNGKYKYATVGSSDNDDAGKIRQVLDQVLKSVCIAGNLVIVKTIPGAAQAACAAIDSREFPEVCGSIAGDDTIFLAVADEKDAQTVHEHLRQYC